MDPRDEFLKRAPIRPQPPREIPKIELEDIMGVFALIVLFFVLFVVPWGS